MQRKRIIKTAMKEVENATRYIPQQCTLGSALDCVGFVYAVFLDNGYEFVYDHTLVEAENGSIITEIEKILKPTVTPKAGDIVTFIKNGEVFHIGIFLNSNNGGTFMHTNNLDKKVVVSSFADSTYWQRYFHGYYSIASLIKRRKKVAK